MFFVLALFVMFITIVPLQILFSTAGLYFVFHLIILVAAA